MIALLHFWVSHGNELAARLGQHVFLVAISIRSRKYGVLARPSFANECTDTRKLQIRNKFTTLGLSTLRLRASTIATSPKSANR